MLKSAGAPWGLNFVIFVFFLKESCISSLSDSRFNPTSKRVEREVPRGEGARAGRRVRGPVDQPHQPGRRHVARLREPPDSDDDRRAAEPRHPQPDRQGHDRNPRRGGPVGARHQRGQHPGGPEAREPAEARDPGRERPSGEGEREARGEEASLLPLPPASLRGEEASLLPLAPASLRGEEASLLPLAPASLQAFPAAGRCARR